MTATKTFENRGEWLPETFAGRRFAERAAESAIVRAALGMPALTRDVVTLTRDSMTRTPSGAELTLLDAMRLLGGYAFGDLERGLRSVFADLQEAGPGLWRGGDYWAGNPEFDRQMAELDAARAAIVRERLPQIVRTLLAAGVPARVIARETEEALLHYPAWREILVAEGVPVAA